MEAAILIVLILVLSLLFNLVDEVAFPDNLGVAISLVQFLALLAILDRLDHEDTPPGA